ncbi:diguanylate cyclase (GGDEF)-like protein [Psychrobacillus insolitus]|uniref:Diguanylate cyclase (GGDEF)-like protein n=1 Tax=Psychrobacillus insolitus TaxID=1461 RepID=A0A2W7MP29_9BACI|nr:diguanylate cyclase [Psychrobacillus insolitus]PZX08258.1 diguanylate cyclase (GGDEF)-like protein [Psychrobacillus insolitus]
MDLQKYKNILFQNTKNKLTEWLSLNGETILTEEVYRFLHSIKGTSGTLQLDELMQISSELLSKLENEEIEKWRGIDLNAFLHPLVKLIYNYENSSNLVNLNGTVLNSSAPLIQIIDDDVSMLILLKDVLEEKGWMVITNTNPEIAVKQYFEMKPDCLILDIHLPQKDGFQILQEIQQHNEKYFIPTIMISINNNKETRIKAYQNGADDFFGKPIDMEEFVVKVNRHLQRKKIFDQSVLIDELTQVYNRKFLVDSLQRFFLDFKRTKQPFSISIVDIDFFKKVNDTYGHLMGDQVLRDFAQYIKRNIRSLDIIYRYGGEEFVIVFPNTTSEDAKRRLNELIKGFSQIKFTHNEACFSVTFSAGTYTVKDDFVTITEAFKGADSSLYEAKRLGRARVECLQLTPNAYQKNILNISVVDDDIIIRTLLAQILESITIDNIELNIKVFENGPSFLNSEHAKEDVSHFLILDGIMPVMDGLEVLQKVKQGKNAQKYKILMLTGRKSKDEIERALRLGADDYVTKPFNVTELQVRIERILNMIK